MIELATLHDADRGLRRRSMMLHRPPRPSLRLTTLIALGLGTIASRSAVAQSVEAEALFNDGDKSMKEGKIAQACDLFEASNRIEARAGTLIRLGECREKNHQLASAWSAYKDALTRVKDPKKRDLAQTHGAALEAKLSYLTITVPEAARLDGLVVTRNGKVLVPALQNRAVPVDGGEYIISAHAPDHEDWSSKVVVPEDSGQISIEVPRLKDLTPAPIVPPSQPVTTTVEATVADNQDVPSVSRFTSKRKVAVVLVGAGAASLVGGLVLGHSAKGKQADADALCPDPMTPCADADRASALSTSGHQRAIAANVCFGVAAAAAIGGGILWFTGAPERGHQVTIVPSTNSVMLVGRF